MNFQNYEDVFNRDNYPVFSKVTFTPKDSGACVCLSGKCYKDCCKKEIENAVECRKKNPFLALDELGSLYYRETKKLKSNKVEEKAVNKKNISFCAAHEVYGDCDDKSNMVHSHTMSQGNVLRNLSGGSTLFGFNDHPMFNLANSDNIADYYKKYTPNEASVTVSFCKKHDAELFSDIEKDGKTAYTRECTQNIEYALKAITYDIYYKIVRIRYMAQLIKESKYITDSSDGYNYFEDYYCLVESLFRLYPQMKTILNELKQLKEAGAVPTLRTEKIKLPVSKINFSLSEVIPIGKNICFVNAINAPSPYVIFSYYKNSGGITTIEKLKKQLERKHDEHMQAQRLWKILELILPSAQNVFFNKDAFDRMSDSSKVKLYLLHRDVEVKGVDQQFKNGLVEALFLM